MHKNGDNDGATDVSRQAAWWCLRLKDSQRLTLREGWQFLTWVMSSQRHLRECLLFWRLDDRVTHLMRAKRDQSNVTHVDWRRVSSQQSSETQTRRRSGGWNIAATVLVMLSGAFFLSRFNEESSDRTVATATHESKTRHLEDGTLVSLEADSMLQVEFTDLRRFVHLAQGEAAFDVVMDMKRPFVVGTFLVDIAAVESRFSVSIDTTVEVVVYEGMVAISGRGTKTGAPVVTVKKGEIYRVPVERFRMAQADSGAAAPVRVDG